MIRYLLLFSVLLIPMPQTDAQDGVIDESARQAYRDRMKARRAEALAERARINASKPRAVYGRASAGNANMLSPGFARPMEMVYSISQGRMVPSRYQRVAVPRAGGGYSVTVANTQPGLPDMSGQSNRIQYQQGDRMRRNPDGTITVFRNGIPIGNVGLGQNAKRKKK